MICTKREARVEGLWIIWVGEGGVAIPSWINNYLKTNNYLKPVIY